MLGGGGLGGGGLWSGRGEGERKETGGVGRCVCRGGGGRGGLPSHTMGTQREGLLNSHQTVGVSLRGTITRKLKQMFFGGIFL